MGDLECGELAHESVANSIFLTVVDCLYHTYLMYDSEELQYLIRDKDYRTWMCLVYGVSTESCQILLDK
jgi:hypothetical protein